MFLPRTHRMRFPQLSLLLLAASIATGLYAEPPVFISTAFSHSAEVKNVLPIPENSTEEQKLAYAEVIAQARANDVSVTDQSALMYHGLMLTQDEEYEEAIPFLEEALRRDPSLQSGWEGLGWSYIKTDQLERAGELWEYFRRLMPEESLPYSLLAQINILHHDWMKADGCFRRSLSIKPNQYDVRYWFAQNLMRIGKTDEAEENLRALIKEDPDRLDIQLTLASLLNQKFEYNEAVEIYRAVNEELPDNPKFLLEQAFLELRVGELQKADELCLQILELDPENSLAMQLRADIVEIDGQNDLDPIRKLIDDTEDPVTQAALKVRLANRMHLANERSPGQYSTSEILGLINDAISEDPSNVSYRTLYAERLVQAGHKWDAHPVAIDVLEKFNRNNTRAKLTLYEIALQEMRLEDATQCIADLYDNFDATAPMAYYYRARIEIQRGNYAEALKELDKMEAAANKGAVFTLLYHDLTESDWTPVTSVRRLHEHILSLQQEGWILIPPTDIPEHIALPKGEVRPDADIEPPPPLTARLVDYFRWCITGKRKFKTMTSTPDEINKPKKYFTITFDDDLRSSLVLGNEVAEDFGVPFGIFTPTEPSTDYVPSRAGWEELRKYAATGNWIVGSQLYGTYIKKAVDPDGEDVRNSLPNRLWLEKRNRLESMNEWDRRLRHEFRDSRSILKKEMGDLDQEVSMVAYPYGDIGQEESCNLNALRSPMQSILSEAARSYSIGFLQDKTGYTLYGDNLLLCRRYQPSWTDEGQDVVRHAYEFHPTFMARKLRCEIAMLMNRPNEATIMLDALRRDGYPEDLCRKMEITLHSHFQNKPNRDVKPLVMDKTEAAEGYGTNEVETAASVQEGSVDSYVHPQSAFAGLQVTHSKANDQIETLGGMLRAGVELNKNTTLSGEFSIKQLTQTVRPHWNAIIVTNVPYSKSKYKFKSEIKEVKGNITHRLETGTILSAGLGVAKKDPKARFRHLDDVNLQDELNKREFNPAEGDTIVTATLGALWHPADNLTFHTFYDRNYVASAVKNVVYNSAAVSLEWKPEDAWIISSKAQYWTYSDDNAMFSGNFDSFWEASRELGIWAGIDLGVVTTSEPTDFYWSPYWDQRIMGVLRYEQLWEGYHFRLDLSMGIQSEKGREDRLYENDTIIVKEEPHADGTVTRTEEEGTTYYLSEDKDIGWKKAWRVSSKFEKRLNSTFSLTMEADVIALREYIDHSFLLYLEAHF